MLFNSYIFLLLFLPLTVGGYFLLNSFRQYRAATVFLLGMSLWFYGYFHPSYLYILCGSIVGNYLLARLMERSAPLWKKIIVILGSTANIGVIFYFKYFDFFLKNVNAVFGASFNLLHIVLPLGISFFTFQQVSFLVDASRGETKGYSFEEYALFVAFFPQLVAGPIVLHSEMIPQFRDPEKRVFRAENFSRGLFILALGLFKKVIVADTFGQAVAVGFRDVDAMQAMEAWIVSIAYTFQLYFDFSGYCDMAMGIAEMFNISLPQNFNSPYQSLSITEFWDRWHMTLTRFLRVYLYFPLGGSRKGKARTYLNIMIVFLASGLWHGASWTFVAWGALHGMLNCLCRIFRKQWEKLSPITRWFQNFLLVNFLWVLFRADSIRQAWKFLLKMLSLRDFTIRQELYECFQLDEIAFLIKHFSPAARLSDFVYGWPMWMFFFCAFAAVLNLPNSKQLHFRPTVWYSLATAVMLAWSVLSLSGVSEFLYFNF